MMSHLGIQSVVMTALHDNTLWVNKDTKKKQMTKIEEKFHFGMRCLFASTK